MQCTKPSATAPAEEAQPALFEVGSLLAHLQTLTDSRSRKGLRYPLPIMALFIILAKLCGEDRPSGIADWIAERKEQLLGLLHLPFPRMPQHNTYRRIMANVIAPGELEQGAIDYLKSLPAVGTSIVVSIDGKTVRGTIDLDNPRGVHLLAAYLPEEGIVLFQVEAGSKENEITVAPKLLESIDLRGKVVVADAEHTQRKLSLQILEGGGDYLFLAKNNQPTLREDIEQLFEGDDRTVLGGRVPHDFQTFRRVDKGHGRRESREITVSSELKGYTDWPGLEQVFKLERRRFEYKTGKEECEIVYGLTSLSQTEACPERLLYLSRTYWGIENGLHHRRDVTFHEDATRQTRGHAGRVMATINNLVISLLRRTGATNLAKARRTCDANPTQTLSLLLTSPIT